MNCVYTVQYTNAIFISYGTPRFNAAFTRAPNNPSL